MTSGDDLYALPPERFVTERDALVKELRAAGKRDEAAVVAALRKPTVAAAAVNHLVRDHPAQVEALLEAGDRLRRAQDALLAGRGDGRALRAAAERERAAVDALLATAGDLGAATAQRVADTLHAAALDEDAREQVRAGTLVRELRHAGLGFDEATVVAPRKATGARSGATDSVAQAERKRAIAAARKRAGQAQRALRAARERRDRAAAALADADEALSAAQAALDEATDSLAERQRD